jgi:hypothetical protein
MYLALRVLRWVLALFLIYASFLKEDADKKVQSIAETWWLKLAYGQEAALSKATSFLRVVARLTGTVFDRLFGRRLFSLRGVGVSVCYSLASFFLCINLINGFLPKSLHQTSLVLWLLVVLFLVAGSVPALVQRSDDETLWVWGLALTVGLLLPLFKFMDWLRQVNQPITARGIALFLAIVGMISVCSDFFYIALTRWMLRKASELKHWIWILSIVLLDFFLGSVLFFGPLVLGGIVVAHVKNQGSSVSMVAAGIAVVAPALNTIDLFACLLFFVLMAIMLFHRLLWPILEGPVYKVQQFGLIRRKGWLLTAAVGLLFGKTILSVLIELAGKL